jgi:hypothetical protein
MTCRGAVVRLLLVMLPGLAAVLYSADAPVQPVPFSHKVHAGTMKLACKTCHPNPDPGETMTIVAETKCMECHSAIKADSPAIQRVAAAAKEGKPLPWVRVYSIPLFVDFSHRAHGEKGNTCAECHGPVAEREQLTKESALTMAWCQNCHRLKKASNDCSYCHEQPH